MTSPADRFSSVRDFVERWYLAAAFAVVLGLILWRDPLWGSLAMGMVGVVALCSCDPVTRWHGGRKLRARCGPVVQVCFEESGRKLLATHQTSDGTTCVRWNLDTRQVITAGISAPAAGHLVIESPNGIWRATAAGRVIRLEQRNAPSLPRILRGHSQPVRCVSFAPDSNRLASGGEDGAVIVWRLPA